MKNIFLLILTAIIFSGGFTFAQTLESRYNHLGKTFVHQFTSAPFPDEGRAEGHLYKDTFFSMKDHYNDSSVLMFIPNNYRPADTVNYVVYFHGWGNNIDTACAKFNLIEQFTASNKNAIFVFPEGPKNAKDSYGGKLEKKDGLKLLLNDITNYLFNKGELNNKQIGNIILAGHSGAYRVIAFSLMRGGIPEHIKGVILFDALYADTEKFSYWIDNYAGKFIDIYTDNGGTKSESENLMDDLDGWGINYFNTEETAVTKDDLLNNRLIFIHTELQHNEVVAERNQFEKFLSASQLPDIIIKD